MIAAALVLCAVGLFCSDGVETQVCVSSHEAACLLPADYLNRSGPISKELAVGMKLIISLEGLSGSPVCYWIRGKDRVMTANGIQSMVTSPLSETDSGEYTLTCDSNNATMFSRTVILHVIMKRPTKPKLMLDGVDVSDTSPFLSVSLRVSQIPQLNGLDLMNKDEVSTVTLSEGQSLLLRCRVKGYSLRSPVWEKGGIQLNARTLSCKPEKEEMCIKNDSHYAVRMAYLSIRSVREEHSGNYTCTSTDKTPKSVYVHMSGSPPTYNNLMLLKVSSLILLLTWL